MRNPCRKRSYPQGSLRSPWGLARENLAGVHVHKAKALKKTLALLLVRGQVQLDNLEELLLHLAHDIRQEQLAEPLPAIVGQHLKVEDADRRRMPAHAETFHVPDERAGSRQPGLTIDEHKLERVEVSDDAFAPPAAQRARIIDAQVEALPQRHEARIEQLERL